MARLTLITAAGAVRYWLVPVLTLAGFGVFMLEAVIAGLGDELIDLVKANLFR